MKTGQNKINHNKKSNVKSKPPSHFNRIRPGDRSKDVSLKPAHQQWRRFVCSGRAITSSFRFNAGSRPFCSNKNPPEFSREDLSKCWINQKKTHEIAHSRCPPKDYHANKAQRIVRDSESNSHRQVYSWQMPLCWWAKVCSRSPQPAFLWIIQWIFFASHGPHKQGKILVYFWIKRSVHTLRPEAQG